MNVPKSKSLMICRLMWEFGWPYKFLKAPSFATPDYQPLSSLGTRISTLHDFPCEPFPRASKIHPILISFPTLLVSHHQPTSFLPLLKSVGMSLKVFRCRSIIYFGKFIFRNSVVVFSLVSFSENNCFSPPSFIFWTLYDIKYGHISLCKIKTLFLQSVAGGRWQCVDQDVTERLVRVNSQSEVIL